MEEKIINLAAKELMQRYQSPKAMVHAWRQCVYEAVYGYENGFRNPISKLEREALATYQRHEKTLVNG